MKRWLKEFFGEFASFSSIIKSWITSQPKDIERADATVQRLSAAFAGTSTLAAIAIVSFVPFKFDTNIVRPANKNEPTSSFDFTKAVREEPPRFRANTYLPKKREGIASGSIVPGEFLPKYDLVYIDDERVWWESEHDVGDTEDDHWMHHAMEEPFRRLVELVEQSDGKLKVQDAYRDKGIHGVRSLHKEGRALDLTGEGISLEKLAKLCWAAGFDWVYYESPKKGGAHVHCSVKSHRL